MWAVTRCQGMGYIGNGAMRRMRLASCFVPTQAYVLVLAIRFANPTRITSTRSTRGRERFASLHAMWESLCCTVLTWDKGGCVGEGVRLFSVQPEA